MSKTYTDYDNKIVLTIPDEFIDVKTGESHLVSKKIEEQIEYHSENSTLGHLLLSALHYYLNPGSSNRAKTDQILHELSVIKMIMEQGNFQLNHSPKLNRQKENKSTKNAVDIKEVEDVLESFGG
ncbi:hypothetical protein [Metabacillus arenae]|uniref:Uncharacterized protein n=1 Tax=Metabacillus arenae TaxID=2771434 RepID=A0A926RXJ5_9BACI|nr:hypothetical protein [Metabacillus arenae]MBD1381948.1 hypothetical protein [Metabacillus arenae]